MSLSAMNIIQLCLSATPVSLLGTAFSIFELIYSTFQAIEQKDQAGKDELNNLVLCVAQLLRTLNEGYLEGRLVESQTSAPIKGLHALLEEISTFAHEQLSRALLESVMAPHQRIVKIEGYHRQIRSLMDLFQVSALLDIRDLQHKNESSREADQQSLHDRFDDLERNQNRIMHALSLSTHTRDSSTTREIMPGLFSGEDGRWAKLESWMIASSDVKYEGQLGTGSLVRIFKGEWCQMQVALKVFRTDAEVALSAHSISREIRIWSNLSHPHILSFLGANVLDENPFIVTPYLANGNAQEYMRKHPECDRLQLLHHVALGTLYLHSKSVIHGDIRMRNILIDDNGKAILCDFGCSRIETEETVPSEAGAETMIRSRNWKSPEQLTGCPLARPSDIYAFGMTIFEIYTNQPPLELVDHLCDEEYIVLVVQQHLRPERPASSKAFGLTDSVWALIEHCWKHDSEQRPTTSALCTALSEIHRHASSRPSLPSSSGSPTEYTRSRHLPSPPSSRSTSSSVSTKSTPISEWTRPQTKDLPSLHLVEHTDWVRSVAFSPDCKRILSSSSDGIILCCDAGTGDVILGPLKAHQRGVYSIAYSPDGKRFASGSGDRTILVWDAETGNVINGPFRGHSDSVKCVAFSGDGTRIVSSSDDKTIRVWNSNTGFVISRSLRFPQPVRSVAFSPDSNLILAGILESKEESEKTGETIAILHTQTLKVVLRPKSRHSDGVLSVAFSRDGRQFVTASRDGSIWVWDTVTALAVSGPFNDRKCTFSTTCIAFSPDGNCIVSGHGNADMAVRVWDVQTARLLIGPLQGHKRTVSSVAFSSDGRRFVSGSWDNTMRVWSLS